MKRPQLVDQRREVPRLTAQSAPHVGTLIIPLLAGTAVYLVFAEKSELAGNQIVWWEELLEISPALMLGLFLEAFLLLPLRILFARMRTNNPFLFLAVGILVWSVISAIILHGTNALAHGDLWVDASVILPGFVVAAAFTLLNRFALPRRTSIDSA